MTKATELYDGTELNDGDTVVLTLAGKGETQPMAVTVVNQYEAELELDGQRVGTLGVNPAKLSADHDHVGNLIMGHGDSKETVVDIEVA